MINLNSPYECPIPGFYFSDDIIYRYHSCNRPKLYFINKDKTLSEDEQNFIENKNQLYLGIELEFDSRIVEVGFRNNKINLIHSSNQIFGNNTFAYYMNDGSLSHGLELITQPATYEVHEEILDKYTEVFNMIKEHGFKSDSYSTCGLHIHFNRNYFDDNPDLYTINLLYLTEKFWKDLVLMSRRNYDRLTRWANKYSDEPQKIVDDMKHNRYYHCDRYKAINLTNENTIEFRIYRGTLVPEFFMAILELTRNMIIFAKTRTPEELQSLDFMSLITSERLKKYYNLCHRKSALNKLPDFLKE